MCVCVCVCVCVWCVCVYVLVSVCVHVCVLLTNHRPALLMNDATEEGGGKGEGRLNTNSHIPQSSQLMSPLHLFQSVFNTVLSGC